MTDDELPMREKLAALESIARVLEPPAEARERYLDAVIRYGERFLERIGELPAYAVTEDKGAGLYAAPLTEGPTSLDRLLDLLDAEVDRPGLNPASRGHLGYIPGGGLFSSALADYLAALTNRYAGVFFASPGAVRMENLVLAWMAELAGYTDAAAGNLASGGSIANLIAIVTAREARPLRARDFDRAVVYATEHVHHCIDRGLRVAGLGGAVQRRVPMDERYRMRPDALEEMIRADRAGGLVPWLVVASAGTVDTGAVDPLRSIGEVAARWGLWFHVDGAYGAFFALTDEGKALLDGMDGSDSVVMDPHKGLFLPYGVGAVLVKEGARLLEAHRYLASYMQDTEQSRDELSPADLSPELSRHFRGLRVWLPLKLAGIAPFRAALEEKLLLARYFHQELQARDGFEVGPSPDLSVVTFRYLPSSGDPDAFNRALVEEIQRDGRIFLSSTRIDGRFTLRLAVLCFRTHVDTIDETIEILEEKVALLEKS